MGHLLDRRRINSIVLGMSSDEADESDAVRIVEAHDEAIPVPADVEYYAVSAYDARPRVDGLDIGGRGPVGLRRDRMPRLEGLFGSRFVLPVLPQRPLGYDAHGTSIFIPCGGCKGSPPIVRRKERGSGGLLRLCGKAGHVGVSPRTVMSGSRADAARPMSRPILVPP